jgi:hypothetical protein
MQDDTLPCMYAGLLTPQWLASPALISMYMPPNFSKSIQLGFSSAITNLHCEFGKPAWMCSLLHVKSWWNLKELLCASQCACAWIKDPASNGIVLLSEEGRKWSNWLTCAVQVFLSLP